MRVVLEKERSTMRSHLTTALLRLTLALPLCAALPMLGCGGESGDAAANKKAAKGADKKSAEKRDPYSTEGVNVGDSCEGIAADKFVNTCDGVKAMACSAMSDFKWTVTMECENGETCVRADETVLECKK